MVVSKKTEYIKNFILFRRNMGVGMPKEKVGNFWGQGYIPLIKDKPSEFDTTLVQKKVDIVKKNIGFLNFLNWVEFVSITGSVAAGTVQEGDDIDVFIVVKNNRMWLYRFFLVLKMGIKSLRRVWGKPFKDKIDTNYICEERGILFNSKNIFILHELLFMIPVYNEVYYEKILDVNYELLRDFGIERKRGYLHLSRNLFLEFFNKIAFLKQYLYMFLKKHNPDWERLVKNNREGSIEFFPKEFEQKKLEEYEKYLNGTNQV